MRIIDIHNHAWDDSLAPAAVRQLIEHANNAFSAHYDGTVSGLSAQMERNGIELGVIQPVATKPTQVQRINDWAANINAGHVTSFGAMHPRFEDPVRELHRMREMGLIGFKMHPEHQSFVPDEPALDPIWTTAAELGMIAFFHAGADVIHPHVHGTAESFANLIERHPDLTLVLAHLGGFRQWHEVCAALAGADVWMDTAYTLGYLDDDEWVSLVREHGVDRILFGSDGPWADPGRDIAYLLDIGLEPEEAHAILGGNAARLLLRDDLESA